MYVAVVLHLHAVVLQVHEPAARRVTWCQGQRTTRPFLCPLDVGPLPHHHFNTLRHPVHPVLPHGTLPTNLCLGTFPLPHPSCSCTFYAPTTMIAHLDKSIAGTTSPHAASEICGYHAIFTGSQPIQRIRDGFYLRPAHCLPGLMEDSARCCYGVKRFPKDHRVAPQERRHRSNLKLCGKFSVRCVNSAPGGCEAR